MYRLPGQHGYGTKMDTSIMAGTGVKINDIVAENRAATREELHTLFQDYVCEGMCIRVLKTMKQKEVKRLLALHLFDLHVVQYNRNRGIVMQQLRLVLGVSRTEMYRWFPARKYNAEREH